MVYVSKYNWDEIQRFYNKGNTWGDVMKKYGCSRTAIQKRLQAGKMHGRTPSETMKELKRQNRLKKRIISDETKKKLSESMKKAHAEGRAHNIGKSRWNNKPSYPEEFFMKIIKNDFDDKDYRREFPFHRFSLDFIWIHKKKVIEIDGEQHYRCAEQQRRDKEKDKLLKEEGYILLRIRWKDMFNDTKAYIKIAKDFID